MNPICGDRFASSAIRCCFVDTLPEFRCIRRISQQRFHDPTPRFPPRGPRESSSPASRYYQGTTTSCRPFSPRFVSFAWRYHGAPELRSFRRRRAATTDLESDFRPLLTPAGFGGNDRISQVPGKPPFAYARSPTPVGRPRPHRNGTRRMVPAEGTTKTPPSKIFRSSIAWPLGLAVYASRHWLPEPAQDSLPGAG